jgi:hypothetical protein
MIVRIDARRLTDSAALVAALAEAFGFPAGTGKNLDAVVDCLTELDNPTAGMSRVHVFPGHVVVLAVDHVGVKAKSAAQVKALGDVVAFVNWRRLAKRQPPVVALAYEP